MELLHTVHVPAGDGPFPTLFLLHGWGASAHDLFGLAPLLHDGKALVIAPQGRVAVPIAPGMDGYGWFPLSGGNDPDPDEVERALSELRGFVDEACAHYPVDPRKTVMLGFSQGGVMAYDLALRSPERYAGLVALSSWLPERVVAEAPRSEALASLPVLVMHGTEDPMIPVARASDARDLLRSLGNTPTLREYAMGHEIDPAALRDLVVWLEEKVFTPLAL